MNVLFCTQSGSLRLFDRLHDALRERLPIERAGFTIADSWAYDDWLAEQPDFERRGHVLLKEWTITANPRGRPDLSRLRQYEATLGRVGEPGLFGAIVADRRLFMGPDCTYSQDYRRRFTDDQLLVVLQRGVEAIERAFDELKPDLVIGFICVTMLDYLAYLVARARGIRVLNLRPTRVGDRVLFSSVLNDPDPDFIAAYARILSAGRGDFDAARATLRDVRQGAARYEGVVRPSGRPALAVNTKQSALSAAVKVLRRYTRYRRSAARTDNHVPHPLRETTFTAVVNPWRARITNRFLSPHFITGDELSQRRYAFFPLHTEPEVSLLVYGRPFLNQIEIVRALAVSLPADMVLVVKEHPWMVGKRTLGAYRKLLNIPRVRMAPPSVEARALISRSSLVAVVTGSIALEAAILGRPVLTFGDCPYNALPSTMVRRCADMRHLAGEIASLLEHYHSEEAALEAYVAAVFEVSAGVNLYSVLLQKRGVHFDRSSDYGAEIDRLAAYLLTRVSAHSDLSVPAAAVAPAAW